MISDHQNGPAQFVPLPSRPRGSLISLHPTFLTFTGLLALLSSPAQPRLLLPEAKTALGPKLPPSFSLGMGESALEGRQPARRVPGMGVGHMGGLASSPRPGLLAMLYRLQAAGGLDGRAGPLTSGVVCRCGWAPACLPLPPGPGRIQGALLSGISQPGWNPSSSASWLCSPGLVA